MPVLADSTQLSDVFDNKYVLALFVAIVTGLVSYFTGTRLEAKKNRRSLKQLSWDMNVGSQLVEVKDELREQVQVSYAGRVVENLTTVAFRITNTGGATVKDEYVRFAFPERAQMLEVALDPQPEPELEVSEVTEDVQPGNRRFLLGHLEPGQSVGFRFVADGGDWANWTGIHQKNEEGGVSFERRDVARVRADQEHIRPFVVQAVLLLLVQLVLGINFFYGIADLARGAVSLLLGGLMLAHLLPVARIVEQFVIRSLGKKREFTVGNTVTGDNDGNVVQIGTLRGDLNMTPRPDGAE